MADGVRLLGRRTSIGAVLAVLVLGAAAFGLGRIAGSDDAATAQPGPVEPPGPDVTPVPGSTPDTSKPFWYVPYDNANDKLARFDRTINGIQIGPSVQAAELHCEASPESMRIEPRFLPRGAILSEKDEQAKCGDETYYALEYQYYVPGDETDNKRITTGEKTFFDADRPRFIQVQKIAQVRPVFRTDYASERFREARIGGFPAVVGPPIFEAGYGRSIILIYDEKNRVLTTLTGTDVSIGEIVAIGEGIMR